jgi:hypothetical protein
MKLFKKQLLVFSINLLVFVGLASTISGYTTSYIEGAADVIERSNTFYFSNLSGGTIPNSTSYINVSTNTNPCNFTITGAFSRQGSNPNYVFGLTNSATVSGVASQPTSLVIEKASYILEITAIEIFAYSGSTSNRQLRINGVDDDTNITSSGSFASPINIGKISLPANTTTVNITSPDGSVFIQSFILYFN